MSEGEELALTMACIKCLRGFIYRTLYCGFKISCLSFMWDISFLWSILQERAAYDRKVQANVCQNWLICFMLHKPSVTFFFPFCRWMLDGTEIDLIAESSHYSVVGGNLVISKPVKTQHVGKYSCLATNTYGTVISQEASVQFGCKWPRCEHPPPPPFHFWGCN